MKRTLAVTIVSLWACWTALAGTMTLLGAGKSGASPCAAFMPAAFNSSALYISWTTSNGSGGFGMACLNGTTAVAANTLGTMVGGAAFNTSAAGLALANTATGSAVFTNVAWLTQGSGTLYSQIDVTNTSGGFSYIFDVSSGTVNNMLAILADESATSDYVGNLVFGGATTTADSGEFVNPELLKIAYSYTAGTQNIATQGALGTGSSGASIPTGLNTARIGADPANASRITGTVKETAFFSTALSTATLQSLTTL